MCVVKRIAAGNKDTTVSAAVPWCDSIRQEDAYWQGEKGEQTEGAITPQSPWHRHNVTRVHTILLQPHRKIISPQTCTSVWMSAKGHLSPQKYTLWHILDVIKIGRRIQTECFFLYWLVKWHERKYRNDLCFQMPFFLWLVCVRVLVFKKRRKKT